MAQVDTKKRAVTEKEGKDWTSQNGFAYYETSALNGTGVKEVFNHLFTSIVQSMIEKL
jgi:hypothetical protein